MRLAKQIGVSWITAHRILRKIRIAMSHRDSVYRLYDLIEIDNALVGGRKSGKRGRGAESTVAVLIAVENRSNRAGFIEYAVTSWPPWDWSAKPSTMPPV